MCGIFGYIGPDNSAAICLEGLKKLEYRGYDSAGLVGVAEGQLHFWKEVGKIRVLEQAWSEKPVSLSLAIAHTRWATHGKPTRENAHPHFDEHLRIAVVHNGIIENHNALREMLKSYGIKFNSETDTEVIAQLIAHYYKGDLAAATQQALSLMQGFWGIAVIHKDHPDQIIAVSRENPLAVAFNPSSGEAFLSSDPNAFHSSDLDVLFLRNDELAVIQADKVEVFDSSRTQIAKTPEKLGLENYTRSKGDFEHFMLKEIFEQPQTIEQALHNRFIEDFGTVEFENFHLTPQDLQAVRRILILGCGTSWHAGCIGAFLFEEKTRIPAHAEIASEFRYKNPIVSENTLVIAISQSGETLDTIAAVREVKQKGSKVLAICNVRNSTLTREADATVFLRAGPEISVCSTKAFTSQLTVLSLLALLMGRQRHLSKEEGQAFLAELHRLPALVQQVLDLDAIIEEVASRYSHYKNFFFLGRHCMYPASLEAALKLKEISYINASGIAAGEMKHGPIALVDAQLPVIGLCGNRRTMDKMLSNLTEVKSRGAPILAFAFENTLEIDTLANDVIYLPSCPDELAPIPFSIAAQLFAYYVAHQRGTDIDHPRNLAKSVTVE
ncbi:MAG: glutamine--fructose-6-phosphate transaminase (isomerizing) [Verrucomicrobia bacterium]|nr:glutamine--fructose-6-phosphate transaminase (isomerizing) [Verrucomicrobiota bacterium]